MSAERVLSAQRRVQASESDPGPLPLPAPADRRHLATPLASTTEIEAVYNRHVPGHNSFLDRDRRLFHMAMADFLSTALNINVDLSQVLIPHAPCCCGCNPRPPPPGSRPHPSTTANRHSHKRGLSTWLLSTQLPVLLPPEHPLRVSGAPPPPPPGTAGTAPDGKFHRVGHASWGGGTGGC